MDLIVLLKVILRGVVEGITEWLPISSTGHLILLDEFINIPLSDDFMEMFNVVIQLGAILAVIVVYFSAIWPLKIESKKIRWDQSKLSLWGKVFIASIPAGVVGILFDDEIDKYFYKPWVVAAALIIFGILFIVVEIMHKNKEFQIKSISEITIKTALIIGLFQLIAAVFPGTSRSGATIIGAMLIGTARTPAAEFTFILAIPAMLGASLIKILKFGSLTSVELAYLFIGMAIAYIVSLLVIKFLMAFIKKHDFKVFGVYRIILGLVVIAYFIF